MSGDYISREAAISKLRLVEIREASINFPAAMLSELKSIPAADVAPVVRCYECKYLEHRPDRKYDLCTYLIGAKHSCNPEDFCSRGERKDGGQDDV